jgi:oligoribonuclease
MATRVSRRYHGRLMEHSKENRLIWIDLEMTGLDTTRDSILEVATLVTDNDLNELAQGPVYAVSHSLETLEAMDDWNRRHHSESGLWQRVLDNGVPLAEAERGTLEFLAQWTDAGVSPMCGNSICQDRRFMHRLMPDLEAWFHYRNLDVSTLKELASRWMPSAVESLEKQNLHQALEDIRESVAELRHYRRFMGQFAGLDTTR